MAFYRALTSGDTATERRLLAEFFYPLSPAPRAGPRLRGLAGQGGREAARARRGQRPAAAGRPVARAPGGARRHPRGRARGRRRMSRDALRITGVTITPVAFADPAAAERGRRARAVRAPRGRRGRHRRRADRAGRDLRRRPPPGGAARGRATPSWAWTPTTPRRSTAGSRSVVGQGGHAIASGTVGDAPAADPVFSPFEVACLDIQGKAAGRPVADLLGGAVRDAVPFSAYLFYKWAAHPGQEPDGWGEALDPDGIVRQARRLVDSYGFTALKLKGGVFPPEEEVEAIRALRAAFPDHPLRLDPNAAWSPVTVHRGGAGAGRRARVPGGPDRGHRRDGRGGRARLDAAGHQHVRDRASRSCRPRSRPTRSRWCWPTRTTGAGCAGPSCWPGSARPSASACPCTPTRTSASAWPR